MSAIINYKIDFVSRTLDLLTDNFLDFENKDKEVTFLLNCLLGLIVNVTENEKKSNLTFRGKIDKKFLLLIPDSVGFIIKERNTSNLSDANVNELKSKIGHKADLISCDKLWFINKLRNGIAHQNIEGINNGDNWIGVKLWNTYNDSKDFEIIFTISELKNIAIQIANDFLTNKKPAANKSIAASGADTAQHQQQ